MRMPHLTTALTVACCALGVRHAFGDDAKSADEGCNPTQSQSQSNSASGEADSKEQRQNLLNCHFAGLNLAAGPANGGFGAQLKGDRQKILTTFNADSGPDRLVEIPNQLFIGYATNDSWNTKRGSHNQVSVDLKLGLDGAIMTKLDLSDMPTGDEPPDCSADPHCLEHGSGGEPLGGYGVYGDFRYRFGNFQETKNNQSHVNQLLAGGGVYFVWQKGLLDRPWIAPWPGISVTYYTPISTSTPILESALPHGIKADFLQSEFKSGVWFGRGLWTGDPDKYALHFVVTYDGSLPTSGQGRGWESLWNLQLSTDIFDLPLKPAVTFQSGQNGGLKYDQQILVGIVKQLL